MNGELRKLIVLLLVLNKKTNFYMLFVPLVCPLRFFVVVVNLSWAVRENFALCSREDSAAQLEFFPFCFSRAFYHFLASLPASLPLLFSAETCCSNLF
jgi:hypothetical protein